MECPHLSENISAKPCAIVSDKSSWSCSVCRSDKSPWICLKCGVVSCGRYINGHAKSHHEESTDHCVCMACDTTAVFCYQCDDFVMNDPNSCGIHLVRQKIDQINDRLISAEEGTATKESSTLHSDSRHCLIGGKENTQLNGKRKMASDAKGGNKKLKMDKIKGPRAPGLRNLGNTCFMNAVLQSLSNIQSFSGYIKQLPALEPPKQKKRPTRHNKEKDDVVVVEELRKTLIALWQSDKQSISPESLFSVIWQVVPRFRGYQQQDAHEFMRYLLDRLHTELLMLLPYPDLNSQFIGPKGKHSIVTVMFGGLLQSEVKCLNCNMESKKHDPFQDLSLDIPDKFTQKQVNGEPSPVCHLNDCLSSFTDVEELEETELYMCNFCKHKERSTKKFWIRRLPNVLCLHLKRFRWQHHYRLKVDTYVDFPLKGLNMNKYMLNSLHETRHSSSHNDYDLAAVIVHHGTGAGSGHYTSLAIHKGRWYHFNDSSVSIVSEESVKNCKAYILYYVRRDIKLPEYLKTPAKQQTAS